MGDIYSTTPGLAPELQNTPDTEPSAWPTFNPAVDPQAFRATELTALLNAGGAGVPALPGQLALNVQGAGPGYAWSLSKTQVDAVHGASGIVEWVQRSGGTLPTTADNGFAPSDVLNGSILTVVSIPTEAAPVGYNTDGTSLDTITLTKTLGITWTIAGADHKSSDMAAATKVVPYTAGTNVTVTAKPEAGYWIDSGSTISYPLTFTASYLNAYTSESFNRTAGALTAGAFTTNAAHGGVAVAGTLTANAAINAGGYLDFTLANTNLYFPTTGLPQSISVRAVVKRIPTGAGVITITGARSTDGSKKFVLNMNSTGLMMEGVGVTGVSDTYGGALAVDNIVRFDCHRNAAADGTTGALTTSAGNMAICVYVNGVFRKRANITGQLFNFDTFMVGQTTGSTSFGSFDDLIVQTPAVVSL